MRVDVIGLSWRDPEECRIELIDRTGEKTAAVNAAGAGAEVRIVEFFDIPAVIRNVGKTVTAGRQEIPVGFRIVNSAGESAPDAYNGDGLEFPGILDD